MRTIAISFMALGLSACSSYLHLQTPDLSIVNVELLKSDFLSQQARVRMRVQNPNDRVLPIKGLTCTVEVNGEEFAHGVSAASFTVPALGETEFDMNLTTNMAGA